MKVLLALILLISLQANAKTMGIFSNFFGKKGALTSGTDTSGLRKTSQMLDEDIYWNLIDQSLNHTKNQDQQEKYLIKAIKLLTPEAIIGFRLRTDKLLYDTYTAEMWCAAYLMNGGCSDDGFEYFRNWIISRGKAVYYAAKTTPDSLAAHLIDTDVYDFESFWYVANSAFEQSTGKDLYDYIDEDRFTTKEGNYPPITFTWQENDPESMRRICPTLFAKFSR